MGISQHEYSNCLQKVHCDKFNVAVTTSKFLFDICDYTVDSHIGTGEFSLALGILHVCGHTDVRSHVPPGMECCLQKNIVRNSTKAQLHKLTLLTSWNFLV